MGVGVGSKQTEAPGGASQVFHLMVDKVGAITPRRKGKVQVHWNIFHQVSKGRGPSAHTSAAAVRNISLATDFSLLRNLPPASNSAKSHSSE